MLLVALGLGCTAALGAPRVALAQERLEGSHPNFAFGAPEGEIALATFAAASNFTYLIPQSRNQWAPRAPRPYDPLTSKWSDMFGAVGGAFIQLGSGYALESAYLATVGAERPGVLALHQAAVEAEALLLTSGITALIKRVSGRCRPRSYLGPDEECLECDAFPSGHTSAIAAFSGARLVRLPFTPMNEGFPIRFTSFVLSEAAMSVTGLLRVLSGAHSWDDVVVGAIVGHATGATVALLHWNKEVEPSPSRASAPPAPSAAAPILFTWGGVF